jgi:hypothetical protein
MPAQRSILLAAVLLVASASVGAADTRAELLLQTSLAAGLAHHEAKAVWDRLKLGDPLELVREPDNAHDPNAVRVEWNRHALGYVPRSENEPVARQLDRGNRLEARIAALGHYRNHRRKLSVDIFVRLQSAAPAGSKP